MRECILAGINNVRNVSPQALQTLTYALALYMARTNRKKFVPDLCCPWRFCLRLLTQVSEWSNHPSLS